jgi:hypothetical protein
MAWGAVSPGPCAWQVRVWPDPLVKEAEKQLGLLGSGPAGVAAVTLWQTAQAISLFPEVL